MTESDIPGRPPALDKAKYLSGRQCAKLLWHAAHAGHLIPEAPANQRAIIDQAREVGALARKRFRTASTPARTLSAARSGCA